MFAVLTIVLTFIEHVLMEVTNPAPYRLQSVLSEIYSIIKFFVDFLFLFLLGVEIIFRIFIFQALLNIYLRVKK